MKKRLLLMAAFALAMVGSSFAYNVGDYVYTATQRVKITGENLVQNGDFSKGLEGWTDAAGNGPSADVWSMEEGLGPNGENVIKSMNGSTSDAALCRSWQMNGGTYVVLYDIKGQGTASTGIVSDKSNCIDIFVSSTGALIKSTADGDVDVSSVYGFKDVWSTVGYTFTAEANQFLVAHFEKLATEAMITNIQIYPAQIVFDDRILQAKLDYVDRLIATGKFVQDTENGFVENVVGYIRSLMENKAELDEPSYVESMLVSYDEELLKWLDVNAADMLKDEKKWSAYGDTRKANGFGTWTGAGGRWFHKNNGGSTELTDNGDEIGHRLQGGAGHGSAYMAYPMTPTMAGTYMFSLDVVGHYMAGNSGKAYNFLPGSTDNYVTDWNTPFKGVTVYAGKEQMKDDAEANAAMNSEQEGQKVDCGYINNPNAKVNPQKFVVFYDVTQEMVDAGEKVWFGMTYIFDPEGPTANLGANVNIANPQVRLIGVTQDAIDYKNEVAKIIVQQTVLNERIGLAKADDAKTATEGLPWGHAQLKEAIEKYQAVYDASLEKIDAEGNVKDEAKIKEFLNEVKLGTGKAYSDSLLASVNALGSARTAFSNANKLPNVTYKQRIADAEAVMADAMYGAGDKATFQAAINAASEKLTAVLAATTDDTREADEATLNEQLTALAEAVEAYRKSGEPTAIIDIDFSNKFEQAEEGYVIKGAKGEMAFTNADPEDNTGAPNEKGIGTMSFALGIGEELTDVLRVGNGSATVAIAEADQPTENEIIRFNFNAWLLRLTDGYFTIDLQNAAGQRVAGFSYCVYSNAVAYNDFNDADNNGMILNTTTAVGNTTGDAGSHADNNKSSFSLLVDYKAKAVQGIVEGPNGITTGKLIPLRTQVDEETPLEDTKIAKFVLTSNYKNYVGRRCWFDDLKVYKYASNYDPTGITTIAAAADTDAIYTLSGVKVAGKSLKPGLYIKNGKKIVIK